LANPHGRRQVYNGPDPSKCSVHQGAIGDRAMQELDVRRKQAWVGGARAMHLGVKIVQNAHGDPFSQKGLHKV